MANKTGAAFVITLLILAITTNTYGSAIAGVGESLQAGAKALSGSRSQYDGECKTDADCDKDKYCEVLYKSCAPRGTPGELCGIFERYMKACAAGYICKTKDLTSPSRCWKILE